MASRENPLFFLLARTAVIRLIYSDSFFLRLDAGRFASCPAHLALAMARACSERFFAGVFAHRFRTRAAAAGSPPSGRQRLHRLRRSRRAHSSHSSPIPRGESSRSSLESRGRGARAGGTEEPGAGASGRRGPRGSALFARPLLAARGASPALAAVVAPTGTSRAVPRRRAWGASAVDRGAARGHARSRVARPRRDCDSRCRGEGCFSGERAAPPASPRASRRLAQIRSPPGSRGRARRRNRGARARGASGSRVRRAAVACILQVLAAAALEEGD